MLREQITCPICLVQYMYPKELQCHHVFCKKCLEGMTVNNLDAPEMMTITCPVCRKDTAIPGDGEGVAKLPSAFHIQNLLDIEDGLKQHTSSSTVDRNKIIDIEDVRSCVVHRNEKASLFCESCKDFVCIQCTSQDHLHHDYNHVEDAAKNSREMLTSKLKPATRNVEIMEAAMSKCEERGKEILVQREEIEGQLNSVIDHLQEALERRRTALLNQLKELSSSKVVSLNLGKSELLTLKAKLSHCVDDISSMVKDGSNETVLSEKEECMSMIQDLSTSFASFDADPKERANMIMTSDLEGSLQSLESFASIGTYDECPPKCHATGAGLSSASLGETASATIYVLDHKGKPCLERCVSEIEFELVASLNGKRVIGKAKRKKAHQYEFSYQPVVKGCHQLNVTIKNEHIFGSPFHVLVKSNIKSLGNPVQCVPNITRPCGVALNETGMMLTVGDGINGITVLKQNGEAVREIGVGNFTDIALGDDDSIYVLSKENHEVYKFSLDGTLVKVTGRAGDGGPLKFKDPMSIAFNSKNSKIYIANTNNHEIQVLYSDLSFYKRFGEEGTGKAQFKCPRGICCSTSGKVYVADSENNRVQVFTAEGRYERTLGHLQGQLKLPLSVATDEAGHVYVTEGGNDSISIFGTNGKLIRSFGSGSCLSKPVGIAVDRNCGTVVVCNNGKNSIQIY